VGSQQRPANGIARRDVQLASAGYLRPLADGTVGEDRGGGMNWRSVLPEVDFSRAARRQEMGAQDADSEDLPFPGRA
jgi:hypothetical protein